MYLKERYDLSEVKSKTKLKLNLNISSKTILDTTDIVSIIKFMLDLRDGKGDVDDISFREQKSEIVGELVENQFRIGL